MTSAPRPGNQVVQKPLRPTRALLGAGGAALILAGSFLAIRALRNPDLTSLNGWVAWLGAPLSASAQISERWAAVLAGVALVAGVGLVGAAGVLARWVNTRRVSVTHRPLMVDPVALSIEESRIAMSGRQAVAFWHALHEPAARFARISETVEAGSRTVRVKTTITVNLDGLGDESHAVPVALFSRGRMENGLTFSSESRISSLSHVQSVAYASAAIDRLVSAAGRRARVAYGSTSPGCRSLRQRVREVLSSTAEGGDPQASELADAIDKLPCSPRKRGSLYAAAAIIAYLADNYAVCIQVQPRDANSVVRVTMERTAFPSVRRYEASENTPRTRLVAARKRIVDFQRNLFGIPPNTLDYPTNMAQRAPSYHLNVRGAEGTYLAHQELRDDTDGGRTLKDVQLEPLQYAMNARRGQRTGHLYVRGGQDFKELLYSCTFYERMPGSMSTAFVGALTTTFVALAIAWSMLFGQEPGGEVSGLLQILLGFPLALTAASGARNGGTFWGGDLGARWATIVTVAVLTLSLLASTVGGDSPREAQVVYWAILLTASATNAIICLVFWFSRAATQHSFLKR